MTKRQNHNLATTKYYAIKQKATGSSSGKGVRVSVVCKQVKKNCGNAIKRLGNT